ncbi:MAG: hypothetical protein NZ902_02605 [Acidilobaceae archaeon]|nr:hypothetical protein [Acidilobaceae archaeon]MCX8165711.1 hypothetical protein [Acidilobaceae archaeon]MDW7974136.1 hypothetical protein [Sulfolobales archaeon]
MGSREKITFPVIYALSSRPSSPCEFMKILERDGYFIAWCSAWERPITKGSVYRCERFWSSCPLRRAAQRSS